MTGCAAISSLKQNKNTVESPTTENTDTIPFPNSCQIFKGEKKKVS